MRLPVKVLCIYVLLFSFIFFVPFYAFCENQNIGYSDATIDKAKLSFIAATSSGGTLDTPNSASSSSSSSASVSSSSGSSSSNVSNSTSSKSSSKPSSSVSSSASKSVSSSTSKKSSGNVNSNNTSPLLPKGHEVETEEMSPEDWAAALNANQRDNSGDTFDFIKNNFSNKDSNPWMLYIGLGLIFFSICGFTYVIIFMTRNKNKKNRKKRRKTR